MSVRNVTKVKRELGFVLMSLNIKKVTLNELKIIKKIIKKDNFYIISIEIVFFYLSWNFMSQHLFVSQITLCPKLFPTISQVLIIKISIT